MDIRKLKNGFVIETENTSYVMIFRTSTIEGTDETVTTVCNGYWGEKLLNPDEVPFDYYSLAGNAGYTEPAFDTQEYPAYGAKFFENEALKVKLSDGVRDLRLTYKSYEISDKKDELSITLKDIYYPFEVKLCYKIYEGLDIIDRRSIITNSGDGEILLETFYSANWTIPYNKDLTLEYMESAWAQEYHIKKQPLNSSTILLESKTGVSNSTVYPYFAIGENNTTENSGNVWFGSLQYSGNWQIKAGRDRNGAPQIVGGISDFNSEYTLKSGESFITPVFSGGFSEHGIGGASRQFHEYQRKNSKTVWTNKVMPVIYNAWATFEFNLDEKMLMEQAERCKDLGIEAFLIDDGWFENRNDEKAGLGDWTVDKKKFPNGLKPLIDKVNSLGMIFGIWVEPEMVSEKSKLYKEHPEWIFHFPTRQPTKKRSQYVLNLGLEEVYNYTVAWLDKLLSENNIEFIKWDMNRFINEVGYNGLTGEYDNDASIKYVRNLYRIYEHINERYPKVLFENCASGGLRADLAMTKWCARVNRSDNQDCIDALKMHEGFTRVNLSKAAGGGCHLHHRGTVSLTKRNETAKRMAFTGMLGSLSVGYDLRKLTEEEFNETKEYIKLYKKLRETVQLGDMYLLASSYDETAPAVIYQFVSKDKSKSVVFVFNKNKGFFGWLPAIKLMGLKADAEYQMKFEGAEEAISFDIPDMCGDTLMKFGLPFKRKRMLSAGSDYGCFAIILDQKR